MRDLLHPRFAIAGLMVIAFTTASPRSALGADSVAPARYLVGVSGMVCPTSCAINVREALRTMPEVADVAIDFEAKTATITTREAQTLTREQVHKVLKGSGFGVTGFAQETSLRHPRAGGDPVDASEATGVRH